MPLTAKIKVAVLFLPNRSDIHPPNSTLKMPVHEHEAGQGGGARSRGFRIKTPSS